MENPNMALVRYFPAALGGRVANNLSLVVKHSFDNSQLLTTSVGYMPNLTMKIGPYLSDIPARILNRGVDPISWGRWPTIGHAPATSGGDAGDTLRPFHGLIKETQIQQKKDNKAKKPAIFTNGCKRC